MALRTDSAINEEDAKPIEAKKITPYQHWFNKNTQQLKDEFFIEEKPRFDEFCKKKFNQR